MLAKSDGLTIEQHTQELLDVFLDFQIAFEFLPELSKKDDFWESLKKAIIFHDIGKATIGFQAFIRKLCKKYGFRHEIVSAIIAQNFLQDECVINAILSHHKNFKELKKKLEEYENNKQYRQNRWIEKELNEFNIEWFKNFLAFFELKQYPLKKVSLEVDINKWLLDRKKRGIQEIEKFQNIFLSAALSICDHNASAGIKSIPVLRPNHFDFLNKFTPHTHQKKSWESNKNILLIAPTGQGKTESAVGWLKNQLNIKQGRAFYILPFTASVNAMTLRLSGRENGFDDDAVVGLLHGKAKFFIDEYYEKKDGQSLKNLVDINKKIIKPFKVITPFQLLKWAFGVKGFEKGFTELAGSYLIFDEIHIYDKELFEKILFFIEWLIEKLQVKVFIMTATMPLFIQNQIKHTLKIDHEIKPDIELISNIKRHKIKLFDSSIEQQNDFIQTNIDKGKSVLVVCNTIAKAQYMYVNIKCKNKVLLHSGFTSRDRIEKEKSILSDEKPQLLVGTQAIEVSLDIDYDMIITEPAPINALIQRFGRVYRGKYRTITENDEANCFVTTSIDAVHCKIYKKELIEKTLIELKNIANSILKENDMQSMLDNIYEPFELDNNVRKILREYLDKLYPFNIYEESEEEFFEQFDGIEVLPFELFNEFFSHVKNKRYLDAEKLFVSISRKKYASNKKLITYIEINGYKKAFPLIGLKYSEELGLLNEENENIKNVNIYI
ncbi:MAG: CRISPR-associated helicase Cas3' [Campylobacteraceae bacterium]|jgi:CRISPR-associated endonuclease/helicase Cas3|nr:CRISPR-associated helicase Cas3' [Campylobacteraceae bacterium]